MYLVKDTSSNGTFLGSMNNRLPRNVEASAQRGQIIYLGTAATAFKLE